MRIAYLPRPDFLNGGFDYEPGEHLGAFEPTQQGKTHLLWQLLDSAMRQHPELRVVTLMPKSRDPATRRWAEQLGLQVIDAWPPPGRLPFQARPRGYVLWPRHPAGILRAGLDGQFTRGGGITVADDMHELALIGLNPEIEEHLTAGAGGGAGLWVANQKTSGTREAGVSTFAYSAPTHILLGHEPIGENRRRFADIGNVEPGMVATTVASLRIHRIQTPAGFKNISDKLYIRKDGPYFAIIGP
jgi:hypothetical protein